MARHLIPSDATIKAIKPGDPRKRLSDGDGLYLLLFVKGGSHGWRFDYRFDGKRNMISLGTYPDTTLALARRKADAARQMLAEGIDPSQQRKAEKETYAQARVAEEREAQGLPPLDSFEAVAREWFAVKKDGWAASYGDKIIARLENDVFPWIGKVPVAQVTPPQLLEVMRRIEARGVIETAHRALQDCSQALRYAVATGKASSNPARDLKGALASTQHKALPGHHRAQALRRAAACDRQLRGDACRSGGAQAGADAAAAARVSCASPSGPRSTWMPRCGQCPPSA